MVVMGLSAPPVTLESNLRPGSGLPTSYLFPHLHRVGDTHYPPPSPGLTGQALRVASA